MRTTKNISKFIFLIGLLFTPNVSMAAFQNIPFFSWLQPDSLEKLYKDDQQIAEYLKAGEELKAVEDLTIEQVLELEELFTELELLNGFGTSKNSLSWIPNLSLNAINVPASLRALKRVDKAEKVIRYMEDVPPNIKELLKNIKDRSREELMFSIANLVHLGLIPFTPTLVPIAIVIEVATRAGSYQSTVRARNNALDLKKIVTETLNGINRLKNLKYNRRLAGTSVKEMVSILKRVKN